MDAPIYVPAAAYQAPEPAPYTVLAADTVSLKEIMSSPSAWAIVVKHSPAMGMTVKTEILQPLLTNMTVDSFVTYGVVTPDQIAAINTELAALPRSEWPAL